MISCRPRLLLVSISIIILSLVLIDYRTVKNPVCGQTQVYVASTSLDGFHRDPVINLLGQSFDEIKQVLGEPDEQGYSEWLGPHYYVLFRSEEGVMRIASPEPMERKIAVSIILGPGRDVLGVKVGMLFSEIRDILGTPDFGPEIGMDNLYYMDYFFGEITNQAPQVYVSFSADAINSPTHDVFIKWEAFDYDRMEMMGDNADQELLIKPELLAQIPR